jgi:hypothetical protein
MANKEFGFRQGLFEISSTQKENLGVRRATADGRTFRYALAGASALNPGKMGIAPTVNASLIHQAASAYALGTTVLTLTVTAPGTAIAENQFRGGYLQFDNGTSQGHQYVIDGNTAVAAAGTSIVVSIKPPGIKDTALTTGSYFSLIPSPWSGITESATPTNFPIGVAPVAVTAAYYYWAQTGGIANVLIGGTLLPTVGGELILGTVAGAVSMASSTYTGTKCKIGRALPGTHVAGRYSRVMLEID